MLSFKVLSLLLASLGFVLMEENVSGVSVRTPSARPVQRRYSEATLASDYSRTMDNMLKKNFVEWLLARREKKSDNVIEPYKREAEPQLSAENSQRLDLDTQEAKDFFAWLLKVKKNPSFTSLEGSEGLKDAVNQEFLTWLMSTDLCRPTTCRYLQLDANPDRLLAIQVDVEGIRGGWKVEEDKDSCLISYRKQMKLG